MEDYDEFVQRRLSQLRRSDEEEHRPPPASSLIRFYGRSILPPLLSGEERGEMQRHRDAAQKVTAHRRLKDDPRMTYVQTILHSVQLRKTPTLEELLRESEIDTKPLCSRNPSDGAVSQSNFVVESKDSFSFLPPSGHNNKDDVPLPRMTSTTYSAFFNETPQQSYHYEGLTDQRDSQRGSQPSSLIGANHQSLSSGYVTSENVENTVGVSGRFDSVRWSHGLGSSEGFCNTSNFFLHNTSNTIAKMPDIISYPPIDGEELERSGLESSFSNFFCNSIGVKDTSCTSIPEDSVACDQLLGEESECSPLHGIKGEDICPSNTALNHDKDDGFDTTEVSENNPELSQALSTHCSPMTELQIQHDLKETQPADSHIDEVEPSEEPYRMSLQALLKKSQEYRRRQRMLRNQAKNTKIQERTQEQPRIRVEEQSLSDKENDEFPVTVEGKKTKERRGPFILTMETPAKTSWENEGVFDSEIVKSESTHLTEDGNNKEKLGVEEDAVFKNNKVNSSLDMTEPKQVGALVQQQPMLTETSPVQTFSLATCPISFYKGVRKHCTIPTPNFCRSPARYKSRGSMKDNVGGAEKVVVSTGLNEDRKTDEELLTGVASPVNLMVEGNVTNTLAKSSQHIDQLESSLSSLKVLISDLESTVKENLENHSQTESNTHSECSFKGIKNSEQFKNDQNLQVCQSASLEKKLRGEAEGSDGEYRLWPNRQSFDNCRITHEDTGPEPSFSGTEELQGKGTERVDLNELRLVETLTADKRSEQQTGKEGLTKSYGCRKQQPPAKCVLSVAQWMRIPDVFRIAPPETTALCNVSVLSDTSNHPVDRRNETAVDGHDSTRSPSLNQSYDVDTPSDLWLLNGSGSDSGSKGHAAQEKHMTPESGGEGQSGVSKVKRRLLMHVTEEARDTDTVRKAASVVRPKSSSPSAAVQVCSGHASQKHMQEQLKQVHAAQVRALQDEHRRQQEELLQALAVRFHLLQSVSFPCSMSASRLGDTLTYSALSQPSSPLSASYRPLLSAVVKGFLTRRLLRTERVEQLVRTVRDMQQFLQAFQQHSPTSRQDLLLQERVTLQLRAARYEVYDIFFSLSARERMQLISWDRELVKERELRRQSGHTDQLRGKSSLSAATKKALERKRGVMIRKKAAERHQGVVTRTGHKTGFCAEQPLETKRGQFRANPQRIPKSTYSTRPR